VVGRALATNLSRTASLFFSFGGSTYGELADALLLVDPWLAELAAAQPDRALVRNRLEPFVTDQHEGDARDERSRFFQDFHGVVRGLSANHVLNLWGAVIGVLFGDHIIREIDFAAMHDEVAHDHVAIANAIIAGRRTKARELMAEHTESIVAYCLEAKPALATQTIEWR
jgi:DNA-binding FadR family transcriptional regulator